MREPARYPGEGDTTLWEAAVAWVVILGGIFGVCGLLWLIGEIAAA